MKAFDKEGEEIDVMSAEEHQAGIPDCGRSTEHREDHFGEQRLYPEKKEGAAEGRSGEEG